MYNSQTFRDENIYGTVMTVERNGKVFIYALSSSPVYIGGIGTRFIIIFVIYSSYSVMMMNTGKIVRKKIVVRIKKNCLYGILFYKYV